MIIRKLFVTLFLALSLAAFNTASAEEHAAASSEAAAPAGSAAAVIAHIEAALPSITVKNSDPSNAMVHLKAARFEAEKLQGDAAVLKDALNSLNQGMSNVKSDKIDEANKWLSKAIDAYKSVK